ncbi:MAG: hypothetical protein J6Y02_16465 [Pseudobutyrivibrio sp.]|nr:hypothetical protein [Pseudobutyrivibrio sp.]
MHKMEMLRDRLCDELDELSNVEKISTSSLDAIDKLTHSIKSIDAIMAMERNGYSQGWNLSRVPDYNNYSYARNRDNMGRYSNKWDEDRETEKARLMERIHELS